MQRALATGGGRCSERWPPGWSAARRVAAPMGVDACRVAAAGVAAARAAVAAGEAACGVAVTKRGESSGNLGREIGNLVLDVTTS